MNMSSGGLLKVLAAENSESVREQAAAYAEATARQEVGGQRSDDGGRGQRSAVHRVIELLEKFFVLLLAAFGGEA